jgi:uncharacterized protein (DUF1015 family)
MAHIEPFRALRYDPARVRLTDVATQPYDKITPEMQERYYGLSPFNLVRIILGKRSPNDRPDDNVYTRAAAYFHDWRRQGVFVEDPAPSLYRYTQQFTPPGGGPQVERCGFIALGKLEDYSAGVVFRHEQTLDKPKADRLDLLRATSAHFGQIFMLYSDPDAEIESALVSRADPVVKLDDEYGVLHQVWRISDPGTIARTKSKMQDRKLIIADGHHRYETALRYRNERRGTAEGTKLAPFELAMMTFVNMDSPGLLILPTHRAVRGLPPLPMDSLGRRAADFFSVEEVDAGIDARRAQAILRQAGRSGTALLAVGAERAFLFSRPKAPPDVFRGLSLRQQGLDVVQLHRCVLERALGISEGAISSEQHVGYVRDMSEAIARVREGKAEVAFLMNPVRIDEVRNIAFAGEVLPQKSTDFYPKLLSGLTIYALE